MILRFWKPYGVLTKFTDADGRPTLADYIAVPRVYPAGRLDMDSEGLLLLTDEKPLVNRLLNPINAHPRTYWAQVERIPHEAALDQLRAGVTLNDGPTRPAAAQMIDPPDIPERPVPIRFRASIPTAWIALTLTEGRNRQVRRMCAAVGFPVLRLVRWSVAAVTLDGLTPGAWEALPDDAAGALRRGLLTK
jgi:23S rRNA pseudouridine2457 synthase